MHDPQTTGAPSLRQRDARCPIVQAIRGRMSGQTRRRNVASRDYRIRTDRRLGLSYREIGKRHGVSHSQARRVCIRNHDDRDWIIHPRCAGTRTCAVQGRILQVRPKPSLDHLAVGDRGNAREGFRAPPLTWQERLRHRGGDDPSPMFPVVAPSARRRLYSAGDILSWR